MGLVASQACRYARCIGQCALCCTEPDLPVEHNSMQPVHAGKVSVSGVSMSCLTLLCRACHAACQVGQCSRADAHAGGQSLSGQPSAWQHQAAAAHAAHHHCSPQSSGLCSLHPVGAVTGSLAISPWCSISNSKGDVPSRIFHSMQAILINRSISAMLQWSACSSLLQLVPCVLSCLLG